MSRANAQVRFPDGTIKYGIYNGTVDVYWEYLFDTSEEAWAAWEKYYYPSGRGILTDNKPLDDAWLEEKTKDSFWQKPIFDVEIADDYGGGDCYVGRATYDRIWSATDVDRMNRKGDGGLPDWWDDGRPE